MNQNELREYLFQQDLAHEKQMDKIIRDAQPKKVNDDYKIKLMKTPIITRDLIGPEYMAEQQLMDLSLDLQLQNMVKQANYAVDGKTPDKMTSSVTEEMIADYKKEVMKPVEIAGRFHLYRPVELRKSELSKQPLTTLKHGDHCAKKKLPRSASDELQGNRDDPNAGPFLTTRSIRGNN
jgi:hypothetical protein